MALGLRFPPYHPTFYGSYFNQTIPGYGFLNDLRRERAVSCKEQEQSTCCQRQRKKKSIKGPIKIASVPLNQYEPEEVTIYVDDKNITLHGQHRSEGENGFENNEFKKIIKLPEGVDPTTVTSRVIKDGTVLVLKGVKHVEEKAKPDDGKFVVKLDLRGFKSEDIKVQLRCHELTVTGKHRSEEDGLYLSRDYSRRVLLPNDADLGSVTSRLSKKGLLTIEASRHPALVPRERNLEVTMEVDEPKPADEAKQGPSSEVEEQNLNKLC